jgi:LacI family transcriptional regulator
VPPSKPAPTIQLVATEAGVSRATVSRAFTRPELLSAETVRHVEEVARRLGYVPNQVARALSTGRYGNVALVVPDIANPFFPPLIRAVQAKADKSGFSVFLGDSDEDPAREDVLLGKFSGQVDGFILASPRLQERRILDHRQRRPLVLINRDIKGLARVLIDTSPGVEAAIRHLHELGHRRVAYVSGPAKSWSNQQRRLAVHRAADERQLEIVEIPAERPTFEGGMAAAPAVLQAEATAAVAFDDLVAEGLLVRLAQMNVDVPGEFSVIGCDDVLGARTHPPLTTVSSPSAEAGEVATGMLTDILASSRDQDVVCKLDTHLIMRSSTAEPPRRKRKRGRA